MLKQCFTPLDITSAFFQTCEVEIHPTNAGIILKEKNAEPIGFNSEGHKLYDGVYWESTFSGLYEKVLKRSRSNDPLPKDDKSIPDCPQYDINDIHNNKPHLQFIKDIEKDLERIDIKVPFASKNIVKNLGAKWDADKKTWYFFKGDDYMKFEEWLPK